MICDKCEYEYSIGEKGAYVNVYGTRCPNCSHLIKPEQEADFIKEFNKKQKILISLIKEKLSKEIEEEKCQ